MLLGRGELAHLLAGARSHVKRNAAAIEGTRANPGSRLSEALPATSLITLVGEIDAIAPEFGLTLVEVVHDETSSFEPNLDWSFQVMSGSEPVDNPFEHVLKDTRAAAAAAAIDLVAKEFRPSLSMTP